MRFFLSMMEVIQHKQRIVRSGERVGGEVEEKEVRREIEAMQIF